MTTPLISVIIPVYNAAEFLEECLNSLRLQTYQNLEFICVNDGSTDCPVEILQRFKESDSRFIIINKENGGASSARNLGLKKVKGEYISFVDPDDRVSLSLYKKFIELENKPDIYMFNAVEINKTSNTVYPKYFFNINEWKNHKDTNTIHVFDDCINPFHGIMSACNKIYRAGLIPENPFPEGLNYEEQYFFFLTMFLAKSIKIDFNPMYYFRNNSFSKNTFDLFKITDMIEALIDSKGLSRNYKYALFQHKYKRFAQEYFKTDENLRQEYYEEMRSRLRKYEEEGLDSNICERLTLFGIYKNILNLDYKEFFEKYFQKLL